MTRCLFVSDLHGSVEGYRKLFRTISEETPTAVFLGGDLLPTALASLAGGEPGFEDFVTEFLLVEFELLKKEMGRSYPHVFAILGNDDGRYLEPSMAAGDARGVWEYVHMKKSALGDFRVYGYSCIPPSPFFLKDWEKYDVSRFVDPGSLSIEEGEHSVPVDPVEVRSSTIKDDLADLAGKDDVSNAIFLFHAPPYRTNLDRAALDGKSVEHVPLDVHVGSIAVRRFIEARQPLVTLHGHVHESARLTGLWRDRIGRTHAFSAAHDGRELALVRFSPEDPESAVRDLL
jgi:Icc-related predicted phosphoesterase